MDTTKSSTTATAKKLGAWLPTRPFGVIDAINRMGLATGSMRSAMLGSHADYNGHRVEVSFNTYRNYWTAHYMWAGIVWIARGSLAECLAAATREYDRGALGAEVLVEVRDEAELAECIAAGYQHCSEDIRKAHAATWCTELHGEVCQAMNYERQLGIPAVGFLANSTTVAEYEAKIDAFVAERSARRQAMKGGAS
jgi:hypothetical protein